jgi:hypothetical protein
MLGLQSGRTGQKQLQLRPAAPEYNAISAAVLLQPWCTVQTAGVSVHNTVLFCGV